MNNKIHHLQDVNNEMLAYYFNDLKSDTTLFFFGGYSSDMTGTKATALSQWTETLKINYLRFDYSGHGQSSGDFSKGTLSKWLGEAQFFFEKFKSKKNIVIGSSMGGWIALLTAINNKDIDGLIGIASAPDFTKNEWDRLSEKEKEDNESIIHSTDEKIDTLRAQLNEVQEQSIQIRERKASSGATIEGLKKRKSDLIDRITSELNLTEENILENSSLYGAEDLPDAVNQEDLLDKKRQEREKLGSVNLKADEETNKYEAEIKKMEQDRADLVSAIVKLKDSINELNQKGRERLIEAFEKVNRKFNEVYTKLFNGGNAKLELVDSDDPLEAGLEMLVSPPGKRLQSITLLSGGEQALTALSLIFAVFLTNPSPICVLDEVDAPLDDANVTRFCSLLEELIKITNTKFIIVTHHALTMSKMNRLYGVTMPEKGISQLVAVDLQKAESMVA